MPHIVALGVYVPIGIIFLTFMLSSLSTGCAVKLAEREIVSATIYSPTASGISALKQCSKNTSIGKLRTRNNGSYQDVYFCSVREQDFRFDAWAYLNVSLSGDARVCKGMVPYAIDRPGGFSEHGWQVDDCFQAVLTPNKLL